MQFCLKFFKQNDRQSQLLLTNCQWIKVPLSVKQVGFFFCTCSFFFIIQCLLKVNQRIRVKHRCCARSGFEPGSAWWQGIVFLHNRLVGCNADFEYLRKTTEKVSYFIKSFTWFIGHSMIDTLCPNTCSTELCQFLRSLLTL